ncbi:MAG: RNA methyltransferase, partial [Candidatus Adiutrix sp.]|nr:RNA methyltransferase [Candidatus Adiutrix sp.]
YKAWLRALSGRGLKKGGLAIISGRKFVAEILADHPQAVEAVVARRLDELDGLTVPENLTVHLIRPELWPELDIFGAGPPLLILSPPELPVWDGRLTEQLTVFLPFQDPGNLGTAIRTAAALGVRVVLLKEAATPWHPKSLRAAGPAVMTADLCQGPPLAELAAMNVPGLLALSPIGGNLLTAALPPEAGFVFGPEGPGLSQLWPGDRCLSIPMAPGVESLNAAAALAVTLGVWLGRQG